MKKSKVFKVIIYINSVIQFVAFIALLFSIVIWPLYGWSFAWKYALALIVFIFVNASLFHALRSMYLRKMQNSNNG